MKKLLTLVMLAFVFSCFVSAAQAAPTHSGLQHHKHHKHHHRHHQQV